MVAGEAVLAAGQSVAVGRFNYRSDQTNFNLGLTPTARQRLDEAGDLLAQEVQRQWKQEEALRRVHDPFPLPVRWVNAPEELCDHWSNIRHTRGAVSLGPLDLAGTLDQVVEVFGRLPSRRLVVLGKAGSGKTILTLRFVLDLLRDRQPRDPIPVLFTLGSWNPITTSLRDWQVVQLIQDHPRLATLGPNGSSLAAGLVDAGHVLPVLDGFDEIAAGLHASALGALNTTTAPMLLTSRLGEYAAAIDAGDVLTAGAAITLEDLTIDDLADYLPRTTRKSATDAGGNSTKWDPVIGQLREGSNTTATAVARTVLSTPLMVGLARTIYSDVKDNDPADLLNAELFPTVEFLEDHLLDAFVPAVYQLPPADQGAGRPYREWPIADVHRWLRHLANHLHRLGTRDLALWQLIRAISRTERIVAFAFLGGLGAGVMSGLGAGREAGLAVALTASLGVGLVVAVDTSPSRRQEEIRSHKTQALQWLIGAATGGFAGGIVGGFVGGLVGLFVCGFAVMLAGGLETPDNLVRKVSAADMVRTDRKKALSYMLRGIVGGLLVGLVAGLAVGLNAGLAAGLAAGITVGRFYEPVDGAWGLWMVVRVWLPLRRRLPWSMMSFLTDAHRRGVLRQAGAVYQFRHARLQDRLVEQEQR